MAHSKPEAEILSLLDEVDALLESAQAARGRRGADAGAMDEPREFLVAPARGGRWKGCFGPGRRRRFRVVGPANA